LHEKKFEQTILRSDTQLILSHDNGHEMSRSTVTRNYNVPFNEPTVPQSATATLLLLSHENAHERTRSTVKHGRIVLALGGIREYSGFYRVRTCTTNIFDFTYSEIFVHILTNLIDITYSLILVINYSVYSYIRVI
jgi:hypothetical protein